MAYPYLARFHYLASHWTCSKQKFEWEAGDCSLHRPRPVYRLRTRPTLKLPPKLAGVDLLVFPSQLVCGFDRLRQFGGQNLDRSTATVVRNIGVQGSVRTDGHGQNQAYCSTNLATTGQSLTVRWGCGMIGCRGRCQLHLQICYCFCLYRHRQTNYCFAHYYRFVCFFSHRINCCRDYSNSRRFFGCPR